MRNKLKLQVEMKVASKLQCQYITNHTNLYQIITNNTNYLTNENI